MKHKKQENRKYKKECKTQDMVKILTWVIAVPGRKEKELNRSVIWNGSGWEFSRPK